MSAVPARKNRPGKHGCAPLQEVLQQQEDVALECAKERHRDAPGAVFWCGDMQAACERLVTKNLMRRSISPYAFRLVGAW